MKNILILEKNRKFYHNKKSHYILNCFENINYFYSNEVIEFIKENSKNNLILYGLWNPGFIIPIIEYLNKYGSNQNKIFLFTFDFWTKKKFFNEEYKILKIYFKAKNHKVITFCNNLQQLNFIQNFDYSNYKDNIIFYNIWCCYNKSYCVLNINPLKKLLLSGSSNKFNYPERYILNHLSKKYKNICKYKYNLNDVNKDTNNYSLKLNKYFACFSSCVYVQRSKEFTKYYNTHIILLKTFEILASGALLVMPKKEEEYLKKIGLRNNENCYLIDFNKNIIQQVKHIFHNINKYNIVRKKGQELAKEKFNTFRKFDEIKKLLK